MIKHPISKEDRKAWDTWCLDLVGKTTLDAGERLLLEVNKHIMALERELKARKRIVAAVERSRASWINRNGEQE